MIFSDTGRTAVAHELERILAMNDVDAMTALRQFIRELLNEYGVATEMVWRIKCSHHAKPHRASFLLQPAVMGIAIHLLCHYFLKTAPPDCNARYVPA